MAKQIPVPKHRKAKSSSAEAFRKFLNKRVDIIEESASDDDAKIVAPVVIKSIVQQCDGLRSNPKKDKKPEKTTDALESRYNDLVRQLEVIQQNQEMMYQKQTKLKKRVKAKPMTDTPRPSTASSPDITMARRQALLRF